MFEKKFKPKNEPELRAYLARLVAALAAVKMRTARNADLLTVREKLRAKATARVDALEAGSITAQREAREQLSAVEAELEIDEDAEEFINLRDVLRQVEEPYRAALVEPYGLAIGDIADDLERMCETRAQALQIATNFIPLAKKHVHILTYGNLLAQRSDCVAAAEEAISKLEAILAGKTPFPDKC
jgi:hypothetical protein